MKKLSGVWQAGDELLLASFEAGETIFVRHIVADVPEELGTVSPVAGSKSSQVVFHQAVLALVEEPSANGLTVKHLRFVREDRGRRAGGGLDPATEGARNGSISAVRIWPRLRAALRHAQLPRVVIPGGFVPIIYRDEMAVADYSVDGSGGWIIPRKDIDRYLASLPPLMDSGVRAG